MTASGWCVIESVRSTLLQIDHGLIKSKPTRRHLKPGRSEMSSSARDFTQRHDEVAARIASIVDRLDLALSRHEDLSLIVVESPSLASRSSSTDKLWGTYWAMLVRLSDRLVPIATVSPRARALYATGDGSASKQSVVDATVERYRLSYRDDNEVDATILAAMGMRHLGQPLEINLPEVNRKAMSSTLWPI